MQRRLFFLFVLFSLVPALVILGVNWQISQGNLDFIDSPGLQQTLEGSIELAQERLARELALAESQARELARSLPAYGETWPEPAPGSSYLVVRADGSRIVRGGSSEDFFDDVERVFPTGRLTPTSLDINGKKWLLAPVSLERGRLLYALPVDDDLARRLDAVVQGSNRFRQLRLYYSDLLRTNTVVTLLVFAAAVLAISLLLSRGLARQIARPVRALSHGAEQVAEGNLDVFVDVDAPDELGNLVETFNKMTSDLKKSKDDLVRAERVAAWQGIARRLAHEIKNPLTPISLAMHRIKKRTDDPDTSDSIATVLEEVGNLTRLADEFSLYARLPEPVFETVDLKELFHAVVDLYVDREKIEVKWPGAGGGDGWLVKADPGQIRQVAANLVKNAVAAMGGKGTLTVNFTRSEGAITAAVADTGPGLPEPPSRVFEPYYTTRSTGTGLGLAIASRIVEDHGGRIEAMNGKDGGAEFRLTLPLARVEAR